MNQTKCDFCDEVMVDNFDKVNGYILTWEVSHQGESVKLDVCRKCLKKLLDEEIK
jgi:hypothetical protein